MDSLVLRRDSRLAVPGEEAGLVSGEVDPVDPRPGALRVVDPAPAVRSYEDLDGAQGRAVFFRPQRYRAVDLAPLTCTVEVEFEIGSTEPCKVHDVSQTGVAFVMPLPAAPDLQTRWRVALKFDEHEAFRGEVVVGSVRVQEGLTVVGVSFVDFLLDVDEVLQLRSVKEWSVGGAVSRAHERAWFLPSHERFKSAVAELRLYLEDAQRELSDFEAQLPWTVLHGPDNAARAAIVAELRAGFVADTVRMSEAIDEAVRALPDGHENRQAKEWSLRHLHAFFMQVPVLYRARNKPLGYPGDYGVMDFMYERQFEGATLFARAVSLAFNQTRAPRAVRGRKEVVKRELSALLRSRASASKPVRVLSIAAGPAQELVELFAELEDLPTRLELVLFEQDKNALAHAWRRLKPSLDSRFPGAVRTTFLHDSIKRLLRDRELLAPLGCFDFVYCAGLYDYLQPATAVVLTRRLAGATAPGGQLLVGNFVDHPTRWLMEHHLDWELIYRSREVLTDIGRRALPRARSRILEEESLANPFLELVWG
jgi:extracellular factor (EF) 3-hydroxypalmitic acid methyl ester biosynthesis protein